MQQKDFEIISIVAARKAEFYTNARDKLLTSLPSNVDKKATRLRLRGVIAELDNDLFISEEEKESGTIKAGLPVSQLKLDTQAIVSRITEDMTKP
jgi:hypothetical protein